MHGEHKPRDVREAAVEVTRPILSTLLPWETLPSPQPSIPCLWITTFSGLPFLTIDCHGHSSHPRILTLGQHLVLLLEEQVECAGCAQTGFPNRCIGRIFLKSNENCALRILWILFVLTWFLNGKESRHFESSLKAAKENIVAVSPQRNDKYLKQYICLFVRVDHYTIYVSHWTHKTR